MVVRQNLEVFAPSALAVVGDSSPNGEGGRGAFQSEKSALGNFRFYVSTETFDSPYLQGGFFESRLALLQDGKKGPQEHVVDIVSLSRAATAGSSVLSRVYVLRTQLHSTSQTTPL